MLKLYKLIFLILFINSTRGQDCIAADNSQGLMLWNNCYSIQNTTYLYLSSNGITGNIPSALWGLINLSVLDLGDNELVGEISSEIGNLIDLENLYLYGNQLTGQIPDELYSLTNLRQISFWSNDLSGEISENISELINLNYLDLGGNEFTGQIPSTIGNMTYLTSLYLNMNQLSGELPSELGDLTNLEYLWLMENQFTGSIPQSICELNLQWGEVGEWGGYNYFSAYDNQLCPPYPSCVSEHLGNQDINNCEQVSLINETVPFTYSLYNAYPNPFNPTVTIRYDIRQDVMVKITIYNMAGRIINNLFRNLQTAGTHSIRWDATNNRGQSVSAGVYLYSIEAGDFRQTKKMILLK